MLRHAVRLIVEEALEAEVTDAREFPGAVQVSAAHRAGATHRIPPPFFQQQVRLDRILLVFRMTPTGWLVEREARRLANAQKLG
ncbi:MAG: hypothetical protein F9K25_06250 [Candidatus Contendobacter sp.]|nr:MAG: hypothetical protein F9K25_06250 [Candidatus Contendobacter sp.]